MPGLEQPGGDCLGGGDPPVSVRELGPSRLCDVLVTCKHLPLTACCSVSAVRLWVSGERAGAPLEEGAGGEGCQCVRRGT